MRRLEIFSYLECQNAKWRNALHNASSAIIIFGDSITNRANDDRGSGWTSL